MRRDKSRKKRWAKRREERSLYKKFVRTLMLLLVVSLIATPLLRAEDRTAGGARDIGRGISSLPREIANTANDSNIVNGFIVGTARGLVGTVKGIGEGLFKIITFYKPNTYEEGVS